MIALLAAAEIARVVVFPDRAQVTRAQEVKCLSGSFAVGFSELPPASLPESRRAQISEGAVEAIDAREDPLEESFRPQAAALDKEERALVAQVAQVNVEREKAATSERLASQLEKVFEKDASQEASQPDLKSWHAALQTTLQSRLDAAKLRAQLATRERGLNVQLSALHARQHRLQAGRDRKVRSIEVVVSCPAGHTATVELTYVVGSASWQPSYDARASEDAVDLALYATVRQATGEDWRNARLSISTALPSDDATPPELQALRVFAEERAPPKKVLVRRDEKQEHAEAAVSRPQEQLERFEAKGAATVAGDGTPSRLLLASARLAAKFASRTVPREAPLVFRVADLVNTAPFKLLPGEVELFHRGAYLGRAPLERVAQGAPFQLSFGAEDSLKVTRVVVEEIKRAEGLFKSRQRFRFAYRFEVENRSPSAAQLELTDQLPVPEIPEVGVEIEDSTTSGFERKADDGFVKWTVPLKPGEKRTLDFAFHVDIPSDYATGF